MTLKAILALTAFVSISAWATEPAPAPTGSLAPVTAPAAPAVAADAKATAAATISEERRASAVKWARTQGYKPTEKAGATWWCKSEASIGQRIPHRSCASEQSLQEIQRAAIENRDTLAQKLRSCVGTNCAQ